MDIPSHEKRSFNGKGKPSNRHNCWLALRLLNKCAYAFQGASPGWEARKVHADELKGKPAEKRIKATLTDAEM